MPTSLNNNKTTQITQLPRRSVTEVSDAASASYTAFSICIMDSNSGAADAEDPMRWKPFSLTFVEYPEGDIVGMALAASSLIPLFVVVSAVTSIFIRRDFHSIAFFAGLGRYSVLT